MKLYFGKLLFVLIFFVFLTLFFVQKANAASLINASDTISTSRPSAAAPLSAAITAGAGQAQIFDNGSFFLASDSAVILKDPATGEVSDVGLKVASMSATGVPSATNRIVYFTNSTANAHHQGMALVTPITATHTIKFTTISSIPLGGTILITFPGTGSNAASPSATGFSFNGEAITPTDIICYPSTACTTKASNQSNSFTLTTSALIVGGTTIYINIGCTAGASGPCTAFASRLINPTKTAVAGTADAWKINIQTTDTPANGSVVLDSAMLKAATIESVQVQATVEPTITFTIAGVPDNTTFNSVNSSCALNGGNDRTNTGISATATNVNLGLLNSGIINAAGQTLTVTTNGSSGYAITASTSGHLINPATGVYFSDANGPAGSNPLTANDTPTATGIVAGTTDFGISPCGTHVTSPAYGGTGGIVFNGVTASTALFTNPWNTGTNGFSATIASYSGGPVSNDVTVVRYAAAISIIQPSGIYINVVSYVATATF